LEAPKLCTNCTVQQNEQLFISFKEQMILVNLNIQWNLYLSFPDNSLSRICRSISMVPESILFQLWLPDPLFLFQTPRQKRWIEVSLYFILISDWNFVPLTIIKRKDHYLMHKMPQGGRPDMIWQFLKPTDAWCNNLLTNGWVTFDILTKSCKFTTLQAESLWDIAHSCIFQRRWLRNWQM
jgi:hypothetical protein